MVYTVDEVSVDLGIPRPTVYRYLKEYSIPFTRRSGRIFVPEESVGKIRTVRGLHDGGFGTEAIRNKLSQGEGPDLSSVTQRLDGIAEALESMSQEPKRSVELARVSPDAHALRMVLARQTLLISAVANLSEMMGDLMAVNGLPRRSVLDHAEVHHLRGPLRTSDRYGRTIEAPVAHDRSGSAGGDLVRRPAVLPSDISRDKFGTLARRRRATLASSVVVLALLAVLMWQVL